MRQLAAAMSSHLLGEVATEAAFSVEGAERFAADVRALAATLRPYARKPEALLKPVIEAAALLTAERGAAVELAAAVKNINDGGGGGDVVIDDASGGAAATAGDDDEGGSVAPALTAAARLDSLRDAIRVHRLSDAQVLKIISRRVDMGCK